MGEIGHWVLEFQEHLRYIFGHVEVDSAGGIVPVDVDATKEGAVLVHRNGVVFFEGSLEMEIMFAQGWHNNVVDSRRKLVACDGADDDVGIPRLAVSKVGSSSCFSRGCSSRWIERIFRGRGGRNGEYSAVALEVKNWVLEEAKMFFSVSPRARNGHEVGGKFLLKNLELLVDGLSCDAGESPVWHLGLDGLGRDSVQHS